MAVKPVPEGYHTATPYLICRGAAAAIDYYKAAFGATEIRRMEGPGGTLGHAEVRIGDSVIMLADEFPEVGSRSPLAIGGTPVFIMLYVEDVDRVFGQAIAAGGKELRPVVDQFYGDRSGTLLDPFGHMWNVATHTEDLSPEEMKKRSARAMEAIQEADSR